MSEVILSKERRLERRSRPAIEHFLLPWQVQWFTDGDDVGRDGCVQVFEERGDGSGRLSPLTFFIQAKAHERGFADVHSERLECRHLVVWTADGAATVLVVVWAEADRAFRVRTSRQITEELDRATPGWREQQTATVHFNRQTEWRDGSEAKRVIHRWIADETDTHGGVRRFHKVRRRTLLTDLYIGTVTTSQTLESMPLEGPGEKMTLITGPGWGPGELDVVDVHAGRVLATALLLFEEAWFPLGFLGVLSRVIPANVLERLMDERVLVPFVPHAELAFAYRREALRGEPSVWSPLAPDGGERSMSSIIDRVLEQSVSDKALKATLLRATVPVPRELSERIHQETRRDLQRPEIRNLIGLPKRTDDQESIWDAKTVNRLLYLNAALAVAEQHSIDVVEMEAGISRIATEKWYSELHFNRFFNSSDALDQVFRRGGVPDVGVLAEQLPFARIVEVARAAEGTEFRDWFWESAAMVAASGGDVGADVLDRLAAASATDVRGLRAPITLKLRFFEQRGQDYILGTGGAAPRPGWACRGERGRQILQRQVELQARQRLAAIRARFGDVDVYSLCPCGSTEKFRFCCGRRPV